MRSTFFSAVLIAATCSPALVAGAPASSSQMTSGAVGSSSTVQPVVVGSDSTDHTPTSVNGGANGQSSIGGSASIESGAIFSNGGDIRQRPSILSSSDNLPTTRLRNIASGPTANNEGPVDISGNDRRKRDTSFENSIPFGSASSNNMAGSVFGSAADDDSSEADSNLSLTGNFNAGDNAADLNFGTSAENSVDFPLGTTGNVNGGSDSPDSSNDVFDTTTDVNANDSSQGTSDSDQTTGFLPYSAFGTSVDAGTNAGVVGVDNSLTSSDNADGTTTVVDTDATTQDADTNGANEDSDSFSSYLPFGTSDANISIGMRMLKRTDGNVDSAESNIIDQLRRLLNATGLFADTDNTKA
ncbi:hypothetical protein K474DRAFT_1703906 [Panus rudis PR-1116 ss-1]|nr:hypothetical protein K474DRAFT_1703906 [Panus rudis PR-1116 ss-1]